MLHEVSARTLVPVTIATATASYIGQLVFGSQPSFVIPALETPYFHLTQPFVLLLYPGLGILAGLASAAYIRSIYAFEDFFDRRIGGSYYRRHMLGMFLVGAIMYVLLVTTGHYQVEGVGYATVQDILSGRLSWFLLALFGLKLLATSLTLGSGASGGVFSPALYLGATLGGVYGLAAQQLFPALSIDPAAFAVAGMAGVVGGSTGAAMAAIVMIFEMTLDYTVIIPMTMTVALSYGVRTLLQPHSIYTMKLARRGHEIPAVLEANFYSLKRAKEVMDTQFVIVAAGATIEELRADGGRAARRLLLPRRVTRGPHRLPDPRLGAATNWESGAIAHTGRHRPAELPDRERGDAAPRRDDPRGCRRRGRRTGHRRLRKPGRRQRFGTDRETADRQRRHRGAGDLLGLNRRTMTGLRIDTAENHPRTDYWLFPCVRNKLGTQGAAATRRILPKGRFMARGRILIGKPGLDGHDRGARYVVRLLRDAGYEAIYTGIRRSPEQIVDAAIREGVDAIGLSLLSGAHRVLFKRVIDLLKERGVENIMVIGGGTIPEKDIPYLEKIGVRAVFTPGTPAKSILSTIECYSARDAHQLFFCLIRPASVKSLAATR